MPEELPRRILEGGGEGPDAEAVRRLVGELSPGEGHDLARERVWRRLATPRPSRSRWFVLAPVGALAAVVLALVLPRVLAPAPSSPSASVWLATGDVRVAMPGGDWVPASPGAPLPLASRIRTGTGRAVLRLGGEVGAAVLLQPGSDLALEAGSPGGVFFRLTGGEVIAKVAPRPHDSPFLVQTSRFRVRVVGTVFSVREQGGYASASVAEGAVAVAGEGGVSAFLHAGQQWTEVAKDAVAPGHFIAAFDQALLERVLAGEQVADARPPEPAPKLASASPGAVAEPLPAPIPVPVPPAPVHSSPRPSHVASAPAPVLQSPPATEPLPPPLPTSGPDDYALALSMVRAGHRPEAAALLEQVAEEKGKHADLALYELGRLRQRFLGDPAGAAKAFELYRERYPSGALRQEVDLSLVESLLSAGDRDRALAETGSFLAAHPGSERAGEVQKLRGDVRREKGDCDGALDDYRAALRGELPAAAADGALYFTAWCEQRIGKTERSRATLEDYLNRFPAGAHRQEAKRALSGP